MTSTNKQILGFVLLIIAYILLIPGLTLPIVHLVGTIDKQLMSQEGINSVLNNPNINGFIAQLAATMLQNLDIQGTLLVHDKQNSILDTSFELWDSGNKFVGSLILLFSAIIPVLKGLLLIVSFLVKRFKISKSIFNMAQFLSKWSMADVFAIALIVTYLASNATTSQTEGIFVMTTTLEPGFYYFLAFCLLSIIASQLLDSKNYT